MFVEKHACEADGKSWFPTRRGLESSTASHAVLQNAGSGCPLVVERQKILENTIFVVLNVTEPYLFASLLLAIDSMLKMI